MKSVFDVRQGSFARYLEDFFKDAQKQNDRQAKRNSGL